MHQLLGLIIYHNGDDDDDDDGDDDDDDDDDDCDYDDDDDHHHHHHHHDHDHDHQENPSKTECIVIKDSSSWMYTSSSYWCFQNIISSRGPIQCHVEAATSFDLGVPQMGVSPI